MNLNLMNALMRWIVSRERFVLDLRGMVPVTVVVWVIFAGLDSGFPLARGAETAVLDEGMNRYRQTPDQGSMSQWADRLAAGQASLAYEKTHGYLKSLLHELGISPSSQILVGSKTSANQPLISPKNPRAIYFNDQVSVAYVPSAGVIEIAAADPQLGIVFYTLEQKETPRAHPVRNDRCLECHVSQRTLHGPGLLARSFLTDQAGQVDLLSGQTVTHRTPIDRRWGGYYVTGTHGAQTHYGNLFGQADFARHKAEPEFNGNVTDLSSYLDTALYLEEGSDIVALLVLDHQVHMQNLLIRLARDCRRALEGGPDLSPAYPAFEAALQYLLLVDEASLGGSVRGTSGFTRWFEEQGPRDRQGRSLRQFDLEKRLFRYPCSYMIYSPFFEALPLRVRRHFYHRLWEILTGEDQSPEFKSLTLEERKVLREILLETKQDLPVYWRM